MYSPDIKEYIRFLFFMLDKFSTSPEKSSTSEDPRHILMLRSASFTPLGRSRGSPPCGHSKPIYFSIPSLLRDVNSRRIRHT